MSDSGEVQALHEMIDEVTGVHKKRPRNSEPPPPSNPRSWHWLTQLLALLVTAGTLLGVLGHAFFVSRQEYTEADQANAVAHVQMTATLNQVNQALQAQTQAMAEMSKALNAQAVELAALKPKRGGR